MLSCAMTARRCVTRACAVCEWRDDAIETTDQQAVDCPLCYAPTRVVAEVWVDPPVALKNPSAVALGRLGGVKGGLARAARLSARRRSEIARKAAEARWRRR